VYAEGRPLFPNIFALLVGDPGVGKTTAIRFVRELLLKLPTLRMTPTMITKEKFIDTLANSHSTSVTLASPKGVIPYIHSSVSVPLDEFSNFLRPKDFDFMSVLTELYDCGEVFENATMMRGINRVENVCLSMMGATTPKTLSTIFGDQSFGMGFTSRLIMVHSNDKRHMPIFSVAKAPDMSHLEHDLKMIHQLKGEFKFTSEAVAEIEDYHIKGMPPIPSDSRFAEYLPRRIIHWLKLCIIFCAARTGSQQIDLQDVVAARAFLLDAEAHMPRAIEHVGQNPLAEAIKNVHRWCAVKYAESKQPVSEERIRRLLLQEIPIQFHATAIETLISGGYLVTFGPNTAPDRQFIPRVVTKESH